MKTTMLVASLVAAISSPALAQTVDGGAVKDIAAMAAQYGDATLETQSNGQPRISGRISGVPYQVFFLNCESGTCEDLDFYAGFGGFKPTMDAMNAWNRDRRFGRAYLDGDLDPVIEYDINLEYGVARESLNAAFGVWAVVLAEFADYVGYKH